MSSSKLSVNEVDLPVIDVSKFPHEFGDDLQYHPEVTKLREACREWGFFRLVNHGIPLDAVKKLQTVGKDLLSMPTEAKDRVTNSNPFESYMRAPGVPPPYESFCFPDLHNSDTIQEMSRKIWPDQGNSILCETVTTYGLSVIDLAQKIMKIILASLSLDVERFYKSDFEKCKPYLRINGYSFDEKSLGDEAPSSNADPGILTIVCEDEKGRFEIRSKEGKWFSVKPLSNSLLVLVGESVKGWSNGRYHSSHHRIDCKGSKNLVLIGLFYAFPNETEIWAPAELVDEDNPRRYKPFIFSDLRQELRQNWADKDRITGVERFAAI